MTNSTANPNLIAGIRKIEKAGGPKWYEWCELSESLVGNQSANEFVQNPNACEAAVVMWAMEVCQWLKSSSDEESALIYAASSFALTRGMKKAWVWSFAIAKKIPATGNVSDYLPRGNTHGSEDSLPEAAIALIIAIAAGVEE